MSSDHPIVPGADAADPDGHPDTTVPGWEGDMRPVVAATGPQRGPWLLMGGSVLMGLITLIWLGSRRSAEAAEARAPVSTTYTAVTPSTPQDIADFATPQNTTAKAATIAAAPASDPVAPARTFGDLRPAPQPGGITEEARLKAPALIVDLGDQAADTEAASNAAVASPPLPPPGATVAAGGPPGLNGDEQFARRVSAEEPDHAQSTRIGNLQLTIPQGAMIPGVLETALDSDLPGYARAVVSRDVRGFDGTTVLVPRGSRVIGEYKSAVAEGQSRAFVIWTRIIRPDGVSIQIGSSGTDPLGRAGLAGTVNRHFLERFGGAAVLSVINVGIQSLLTQPSTQIVIGSSSQATSLAGSAFVPANISPTIKVPQGSAIRIFVARDLDFSPTGAAAP